MENEISTLQIEKKIFVIRGVQVMIDRDIAELYGVETKVLNQAVKRNITRFPEEFMFQLNEEEFENWKSQIAISNSNLISQNATSSFSRSQIVTLKTEQNQNVNLKSQFVTSNWGGVRKLPYAFTEQGLAMLSGLLNSDIAIDVNINIMRAFVTLRHSIGIVADKDLRYENLSLRIDKLNDYIENVLQTQNDINDDTAAQLELINQTLAELQAENTIRKEFAERKPVGFKIEK